LKDLFGLLRPGAVYPLPVIHLYGALATALPGSFGGPLIECIKMIKTWGIPITAELVLLPFAKGGKRKKTGANEMERFLPHFLPVLTRFPPNWEFAAVFLDTIAFAKFPELQKVAAAIEAYLKLVVAKFREEVIAWVDTKIKAYGKKNYLMLLTVLEELRVKRPILTMLPEQFTRLVGELKVNADELIARTIDRNHVKCQDKGFLNMVLDRTDISDETRARILGALG
jgi:hypothetical protein